MPSGPQELAEARAGLQAQEQELCRAQGRQEELLRKLQEAQEREAAMASQTQALNSQLEEAWGAQKEVSDGGWVGTATGPCPCDPLSGWRKPGEPERPCAFAPPCGWPRSELGKRWGGVGGVLHSCRSSKSESLE